MNNTFNIVKTISNNRNKDEKILMTRGILLTNRCVMQPLCYYCNYPISTKVETTVEDALKSAHDLVSRGIDRVTLVSGWLGYKNDSTVPYIKAIKKEYPDLYLNAALGAISSDCLSAMYSAGLDQYGCNVESVPRILNIIKGQDDFDERLNTLIEARNVGLDISTGFIMGLGETEDDLHYILNRIIKLKPESIFVSPFVPYEGTKMSHWQRPSLETILNGISMTRQAARNSIVGVRIIRNGDFYPTPIISLFVYAGANMLAPILDGYGRRYEDVIKELESFDHSSDIIHKDFTNWKIPKNEFDEFIYIHSKMFPQ